MSINKIQGSSVLAALLGAALLFGGCDQPPLSDEAPRQPNAAGEETVKLYWTGLDENNQPVLREKTITKAQANEIHARRAAARANQAAGGGRVEMVQSAYTLTSDDWAASCQYYDWFLMTSGSNGSGDIYCAKYSSISGQEFHTAFMPFVPAYYDLSSSSYISLCTASTNCHWFECSSGSAVWQNFSPGSGTGNISPPSTVRYVHAQSLSWPC